MRGEERARRDPLLQAPLQARLRALPRRIPELPTRSAVRQTRVPPIELVVIAWAAVALPHVQGPDRAATAPHVPHLSTGNAARGYRGGYRKADRYGEDPDASGGARTRNGAARPRREGSRSPLEFRMRAPSPRRHQGDSRNAPEHGRRPAVRRDRSALTNRTIEAAAPYR